MFSIDERIEATARYLVDWSLSRVFLKNEQHYPWIVLVPRRENIQELYQLSSEERSMLMEEVNQASLLVKNYFNPDKLNIAAIGNVVSQLHIHVVGRHQSDSLWPQSIWQASMQFNPYTQQEFNKIVNDLKLLCTTTYVY